MLISGTTWRPKLPDIEKFRRELTDITAMPNKTDQALTLMLWAMRKQNSRIANEVKAEYPEGTGILLIEIGDA